MPYPRRTHSIGRTVNDSSWHGHLRRRVKPLGERPAIELARLPRRPRAAVPIAFVSHADRAYLERAGYPMHSAGINPKPLGDLARRELVRHRYKKGAPADVAGLHCSND